MPGHEIQFKIRGGNDAIDPRSLNLLLDGLRQLMESAGAEQVVISDLRIGSVAGSVRERPGLSPANVDFLHRGVNAFETREPPGRGWDIRMLKALEIVHSAVESAGSEAIELKFGDRDWTELTPEGRAAVQDRLNVRSDSLGSVTGVIDRWTERRKHEAGMVDEATGAPVKIRYSREMSEKVVQFSRRRVTVWGLLRRDLDGRKVEIVMEDLEALPDGGDVSVDALVGSLGTDWTAGMDSVEWVRAQRGEG